MKRFLFLFLFLFCVYFFDVSYIFHGIRCTYLRGEASAQIDDHRFFSTREVVSLNSFTLPNSENYSNETKNKKLKLALEDSKSVAFLVVQNDSVQLESYWDGVGLNSLTNSFSMAKSIISILVGCAVEDGYIKDLDQSVFDFVPEIKSFKNSDVKIKHLLEMSSGYDWFENYKQPISVTAKAYYGNRLRELILNRRFVEPPGESYHYSSGSTQVLGLILERAVGESVSSYAGRALWTKIGAKQNALWTLDSKGGSEKVFCCFNSNARDFSKIGLLMLNRGLVGASGERVVSEKHIDWLLSVPKILSKKDEGRVIKHYSNGWWLARVLEKDVFYARGFLGQYIVVIPELNLVFVRLGKKENEKSGEENEYKLTKNLRFFIESIIKDYPL